MELSELLIGLDQLNLPKDQYVIVGSGPLAAHGIRVARDLDILPTADLWPELVDKYQIATHDPCDLVRVGEIEFLGPGSYFLNSTIASVKEMIETADMIYTHPFLNLQLLKEFKKIRNTSKDQQDIILIEQYLKRKERGG